VREFVLDLLGLPQAFGLAFRGCLLFTRQHVARGEGAYGTVKATIVVLAHELLDDALCLLERQRALRSNAIALESLVMEFEFPVALWVVRGCANVCHAAKDERTI